MNNYYQPGNGSTQYWQQPQQPEMSLDARVSMVMKSVYVKMFLALLVTAAVSVGVALLKTDISLYIATHSGVYWMLALAELGLVFWISSRIDRMSSALSTGLFYLFAVINGLVLSILCLMFTFDSLFKTFLICAGTFGAMSVYGYFTVRDLAKIGSILYMALFGLIIMVVVNIFWANSTLDWIISGAGVLIFIGLTAWDTQKIKRLAAANPGIPAQNLATWGALNLYLDFINLFIYLLRFFGNSRN